MEIYVNDFPDIIQNYAEKISEKSKVNDYAIEDGCFDLVHDIRKRLYVRLCEGFMYVVDNTENISNETKEELKNDLCKLINDL